MHKASTVFQKPFGPSFQTGDHFECFVRLFPVTSEIFQLGTHTQADEADILWHRTASCQYQFTITVEMEEVLTASCQYQFKIPMEMEEVLAVSWQYQFKIPVEMEEVLKVFQWNISFASKFFGEFNEISQ